jgi:hypothetical protein
MATNHADAKTTGAIGRWWIQSESWRQPAAKCRLDAVMKGGHANNSGQAEQRGAGHLPKREEELFVFVTPVTKQNS